MEGITEIGVTDSQFSLALLAQFASVFKEPGTFNKEVIFCPREQGIRERAEALCLDIREEDGVPLRPNGEVGSFNFLDFISFWREGMKIDQSRGGTPLARRGMYVSGDTATGVASGYKAVPVTFPYSITFWTTTKEQTNRFIRQYLFWKHELFQMEYTIVYPGSDQAGKTPVEVPMVVQFEFGEIQEEVKNYFEMGKLYTVDVSMNAHALLLKEFGEFVVGSSIIRTYDNGRATPVLSDTIIGNCSVGD